MPSPLIALAYTEDEIRNVTFDKNDEESMIAHFKRLLTGLNGPWVPGLSGATRYTLVSQVQRTLRFDIPNALGDRALMPVERPVWFTELFQVEWQARE
jgi:hypothetical protein